MDEQNQDGHGVYIDRGEPLPSSYGANLVVALVRDPEHIFVYWDVQPGLRVAETPLVLRVHCLSEGTHYDLEPDRQADNWYLRVMSNQAFRLELYARSASGELEFLASSKEVATPLRWGGESGEAEPAELVHAKRHPLARGKRAEPLPISTESPGRAAPAPVPAPIVDVSGYGYNRGPTP